MLLRFGCSNFRSFRDYQEISLVASSLKDEGSDLFEADSGRYKVVPITLIYGANASGKSNLIKALFEMLFLIAQSHRRFDPEQKIPREYFRLDEKCEKNPTVFDIDFVIEENRYHYGFEYNNERFLQEWLYEYKDGHRRTLFYREEDDIEFGRYLQGQNRSTFDLTRPNSLFLSAASQNNHKYISRIHSYLRRLGFNNSLNESNAVANFANSDSRRKAVLSFLSQADTGICGARVEKKKMDPEIRGLLGVVEDYFAQHASKIGKDPLKLAPKDDEEVPELSLAHRTEFSKEKYFPIDLESRGTIRALDLALEAFKAIDSGGVLIVDELEASLHTLVANEILKIFSKKDINKSGAQLIATTHDTNLLRSSYIRRDQIWFAEKDKFGETNIYPLTRIRTRNTDNLEKGYLEGRFGAIPFAGPISPLFEEVGHNEEVQS